MAPSESDVNTIMGFACFGAVMMALSLAIILKAVWDRGYRRGRKDERQHVKECLRTNTPFNMIPPPEPWPRPSKQ